MMSELEETDIYCPNCDSCGEWGCCITSCEVCGIYDEEDLITKGSGYFGAMGKEIFWSEEKEDE